MVKSGHIGDGASTAPRCCPEIEIFIVAARLFTLVGKNHVVLNLASRRPRPAAFTLIELLVVIAIIAILAGIVFPVFAKARGKAREAGCISNLRQIGMGLQMYAQDYDGQLPWAKDASDDAVKQMWPQACWLTLNIMPFLHPFKGGEGALDAYVKNRQVWRCPSDTGFTELDNNFDPATGGLRKMYAKPTMFEAFGGSYLYRTEISFRHKSLDGLSGWRRGPDGQWQEVGATEINMLFDGNGSWHGTGLFPEKRYAVLFADGHAKSRSRDQYDQAWATALDPNPSSVDLSCP